MNITLSEEVAKRLEKTQKIFYFIAITVMRQALMINYGARGTRLI